MQRDRRRESHPLPLSGSLPGPARPPERFRNQGAHFLAPRTDPLPVGAVAALAFAIPSARRSQRPDRRHQSVRCLWALLSAAHSVSKRGGFALCHDRRGLSDSPPLRAGAADVAGAVISRQHAEHLIRVPKQAALGANVRWNNVVAADGTVFRRVLSFAVHASGETDQLMITGLWRGQDAVQIMFQLAAGRREIKLTRLCLVPHHGTQVHWHWYEDVPGPDEQPPLSHPPVTLDPTSLLQDVFLPEMRISYQIGMTP